MKTILKLTLVATLLVAGASALKLQDFCKEHLL